MQHIILLVICGKQEHGVDKIYKLEPGKSLSTCDKYASSIVSLFKNHNRNRICFVIEIQNLDNKSKRSGLF